MDFRTDERRRPPQKNMFFEKITLLQLLLLLVSFLQGMFICRLIGLDRIIDLILQRQQTQFVTNTICYSYLQRDTTKLRGAMLHDGKQGFRENRIFSTFNFQRVQCKREEGSSLVRHLKRKSSYSQVSRKKIELMVGKAQQIHF